MSKSAKIEKDEKMEEVLKSLSVAYTVAYYVQSYRLIHLHIWVFSL